MCVRSVSGEAGGGAAISTASSRALRFPPVTRTVLRLTFSFDKFLFASSVCVCVVWSRSVLYGRLISPAAMQQRVDANAHGVLEDKSDSVANLLLRRHPQAKDTGAPEDEICKQRNDFMKDFSMECSMDYAESLRGKLEWQVVIGGSAVSMAVLAFIVKLLPFGTEAPGLGPLEQQALTIAVTFQCASLLQDLVARGEYIPGGGVRFAVLGVKTLALITNLSICVWGDQFIIVDQITGRPQCMLRWVEWTVLAHTMTYLVERVGGTSSHEANITGASQGLSTLCGLLLPFCSSLYSWVPLLVLSFILYFYIFHRFHVKSQYLQKMRATLPESSFQVTQADLSFRMMRLCVVTWTVRTPCCIHRIHCTKCTHCTHALVERLPLPIRLTSTRSPASGASGGLDRRRGLASLHSMGAQHKLGLHCRRMR